MTNISDSRRIDYQDRLSRQNSGPESPVMGYRREDGTISESVKGDADFPFFKDPPQTAPVEGYRQPVAEGAVDPLPLAASFAALETLGEIDVEGYRRLDLFTLFWAIQEVAETEASLVLVVEVAVDLPLSMSASDGGQRVWFPEGLVDPAVRGIAAPFSIDPPAFAFQDTHAREVRFASDTVVAPYDPVSPTAATTIPYDVTPYSRIRFRAGATNATSTAQLLYSLTR